MQDLLFWGTVFGRLRTRFARVEADLSGLSRPHGELRRTRLDPVSGTVPGYGCFFVGLREDAADDARRDLAEFGVRGVDHGFGEVMAAGDLGALRKFMLYKFGGVCLCAIMEDDLELSIIIIKTSLNA